MKLSLSLFAAMFSLSITTNAETAVLKLAKTIPLPNVEGRFDHFAIDEKGQRLFVAALGNNTLEIVDLKNGQRLESALTN